MKLTDSEKLFIELTRKHGITPLDTCQALFEYTQRQATAKYNPYVNTEHHKDLLTDIALTANHIKDVFVPWNI